MTTAGVGALLRVQRGDAEARDFLLAFPASQRLRHLGAAGPAGGDHRSGQGPDERRASVRDVLTEWRPSARRWRSPGAGGGPPLHAQREEDAARPGSSGGRIQETDQDNAGAEAEAKRIVRDARAAADQVFAELGEMRKAQVGRPGPQRQRGPGRPASGPSEAEEAKSPAGMPAGAHPKPSRPIRAGDLMRSRRQDAGECVRGQGRHAAIKSSILKMKARADSAAHRRRQAEPPGRPRRRHPAERGPGAAVLRPEFGHPGPGDPEAEGVVENFLSTAVVGRLETVTIIPRGAPGMRKAVHDVLRRNRAVRASA